MSTSQNMMSIVESALGSMLSRFGRTSCVFSRMRSEGFPFIGGGLGVGPVFASRCSCRRDRRRNRRRNSVPMGKVARRVILSCPCLSSAVAVTMVEAAKRVVFDRVKVSKLEEVSYEMLVLTLPHVSSCVSVAFL